MRGENRWGEPLRIEAEIAQGLLDERQLVLLVIDGERRLEPDPIPITSENTNAQTVKGARLHELC